MREPLDELFAGFTGRVTFDRRRDFTLPCYFCDASDLPRTLVTIGHYGNGDEITRPVCPRERCRRIADAPAPTERAPAAPGNAAREAARVVRFTVRDDGALQVRGSWQRALVASAHWEWNADTPSRIGTILPSAIEGARRLLRDFAAPGDPMPNDTAIAGENGESK